MQMNRHHLMGLGDDSDDSVDGYSDPTDASTAQAIAASYTAPPAGTTTYEAIAPTSGTYGVATDSAGNVLPVQTPNYIGPSGTVQTPGSSAVSTTPGILSTLTALAPLASAGIQAYSAGNIATINANAAIAKANTPAALAAAQGQLLNAQNAPNMNMVLIIGAVLAFILLGHRGQS